MKKRTAIIVLLCLAGITGGVILLTQRTPVIKHIVLISMDTTRADYLSCYGYPKETTPSIDMLAHTSTRFENVVSPVPITLAAHSSMLTGTIPPYHGVHNNIGYQLADKNLTLAELLKKNGFNTGAIVSSYVLDRRFGLNQGFNSYDGSFDVAPDQPGEEERPGDESTQVALDWLERNKDGKSFLFLHYYDAHAEYEPPEPFATKFSGDPYAGEIAFVDHCIGQVIQKLKDLKMYDSTLLIVTGDHGEMLGEHGESQHSYFIYESAIKVPLIVHLPEQTKAQMISQTIGLVDIVPTICALLHIEIPSPVQGRDLGLFLKGTTPQGYERNLYSESIVPRRLGASTLMAISTGKWKYIQAPRPELYDIAADPAEEHNLSSSVPQRARILEDKLSEILEKAVRTDADSSLSLDAESIRRLESLGYVAGKAGETIAFDENQDDPKDYIQILEQYLEAAKLFNEKEYDKAKTMLLPLTEQRPQFMEVFKRLGDIAVDQENFEEALQHYRRVVALDTAKNETEVANNLAWIQATRPSLPSRSIRGALALSKGLCAKTNYSDPNSLDTLSVCYAAAGNFHRAHEVAQKAFDLAKAANDAELAQRIVQRLRLFAESKAYIEE